jgi:hypothetical protein
MASAAPAGIAGTGRLAQALGRALLERGDPPGWVAGRDRVRTGRAARFIESEGSGLKV